LSVKAVFMRRIFIIFISVMDNTVLRINCTTASVHKLVPRAKQVNRRTPIIPK
jgi:hypothetical protein